MNTRYAAAFVALGLLVACDEAPPEDSTDTGTTDVGEGSADVVEDVVEDVAEDVAVDVVDEEVAEEVTPDVVDEEVAVDVVDEEVAEDVVDEEVEEVDGGVDCTDDSELCEDPYVCIEGVCRVPIGGTTWAEDDFAIVEPEELAAIFATFKSFATNVKFMVVDVPEGTPPLTARNGAADIVDDTADPIQVSYQADFPPGNIVFSPLVDDEAPLDGNSWISAAFLYELRAVATIELPTMDPITAAFGLDAEDVIVTMNLAGGDVEENTARLEGYVTRTETEYRTLMTPDEFPGFGALFCRDDASWDPGDEWNLSDVLDCNAAEMDVDSDGDLTMDSYRVVITASFVPAELIETL